MQLVDLRRPRNPGEPELEVWASPGAELFRALSTLTDPDCDGFDVGDERLGELRAHLDPALLTAADTMFPHGRHWLVATSLVADLPAPATVDDLLAALEDQPDIAWRAIVGSLLGDGEVDPLAAAVIGGEAGPDEVRAAIDGMDEWFGTALEGLADLDPIELGTRLHATLTAFHAGVGADMVAEALGPMQREATARQAQLAAGTPMRRLVVEATNGYELGEGLASDRVLLLPSYWFRPWLIISRHAGTEVLTTPIAEEHLALPSQAPSPSLVKLFKALGDDGRLRLVRRMAAGPLSLGDAMEELDVAKTTAHHHLSILRQAGLVTVRENGRSKTYGLRQDPPAAAATALQEYVGPVARTILSTDD